MESWDIATMEKWKNGIMEKTGQFHYSNISLLLCIKSSLFELVMGLEPATC
ncbi:MAG: hypothetical protein WC557_08375 [Ignavibacteriaceae bacterium]